MKKWLPIVLLVSILLTACQSEEPQGADPNIDVVNPSLIAQGYVEPAQYIDLAFAQPGRVADVLVQEGELVSAGQVVARLEGQPAAQVALERARLETLTATQALDALSPELAMAQAAMAVAEAEKAIEDARDMLENAGEEGALMTEDQARTALELAEVQLDLAEQRQAELVEDRDPAVALAAQRLASAQAAEASAQAALETLELKTPLAGTVTSLTLKIGQFVPVGQIVLSVADFSAWVIKTTDLTELAVTRLTVGEAAAIELDALTGQTLSGEISAIAQRFEEKRGDITYTVTITLKEPVADMRWGMTGQVTFEE